MAEVVSNALNNKYSKKKMTELFVIIAITAIVWNLPTEIFGDGRLYMLYASGDSMEDEGIEDGDLVVVRMDAEPREGDLVIALDEDSRNTLKKYGGISRKDRRAMLLYCNEKVYGDKVIYVDHLECQGVVSHVIKKK